MKAIFNGELVDAKNFSIPIHNRSFLYADSVQELFISRNGKIQFLEEHYFNLCASMRIFRLPIPDHFTQEKLEELFLLLLDENQTENIALRIQVFRNNLGSDFVKQQVSYWIQTESIKEHKETYSLDTYRDYVVNTNLYDRVPRPSGFENVAKIFAEENDLDDLLLINHDKKVAQTLNGTIFLIKDKKIATPPESDGALINVPRKQLLEKLKESIDYEFEESSFFPYQLAQSDMVFIVNQDYTIQFVTNFKKKSYQNATHHKIRELLKF